jgi:dTDP-D-glucose 4,6-dehydratase
LRQTVQWYLDNEDWWAPLTQLGGALKRQGIPLSGEKVKLV